MSGSLYKGYGAFYGWKILAVVFVICALMQGIILYGASVVNTFAMLGLGFSRTELGLTITVYQLFGSLVMPFVSWFINRFGVRRAMVAGGAFTILGCALLMTVVSSGIGYVAVYSVVTGFGMALGGMVPLQVIVNHWFRERRGLAMGITFAGAGIGGFASSAVFTAINAAFDWRACWAFVACTSLIMIVLTVVFIVNRPEELGQHPDGRPAPGGGGQGGAAPSGRRAFKVLGDIPVKAVLRDARFWVLLVSLIAMRFTYNVCVTNAMDHFMLMGVSTLSAAMAVGARSLVGVAGRIFGGWAGDRIDSQRVLLAGYVLMLAGTFFLWQAASEAHIWLYAVLVGVGFGLAYVSSIVIVSNYYGADTYTSLMSFFVPTQYIIGSLGPTFAGIVFDVTGSYSIAMATCFAMMAGAVVLVLFVRPPRKIAEREGVRYMG